MHLICSNCGSTDHVAGILVVPKEAGGQESNTVLLCRACDMARVAVSQSRKDSERRLVNLLVSQVFHARLKAALAQRNGYRSMSALVRSLVCTYVADPERFDDLHLHQVAGSEVKINVWVDCGDYRQFRIFVKERHMTVTDAIKGLVTVYLDQARPLLEQ